jgi:hypothetical protein
LRLLEAPQGEGKGAGEGAEKVTASRNARSRSPLAGGSGSKFRAGCGVTITGLGRLLCLRSMEDHMHIPKYSRVLTLLKAYFLRPTHPFCHTCSAALDRDVLLTERLNAINARLTALENLIHGGWHA